MTSKMLKIIFQKPKMISNGSFILISHTLNIIMKNLYTKLKNWWKDGIPCPNHCRTGGNMAYHVPISVKQVETWHTMSQSV